MPMCLQGDFKLGKQLGGGCFGSVWSMTWQGKTYAIKVPQVRPHLLCSSSMQILWQPPCLAGSISRLIIPLLHDCGTSTSCHTSGQQVDSVA